MRDLWELYKSFFKIGILTFGGGLAMLPMLQRELVENRGWTTEDEILNYFAVGQCTPGIIAVNTATFVGYKRKKYAGAFASTFGVVSPSLIIIICIATFLGNVNEYPIVINALWGIRVAASAMILDSWIKMYKKGVKSGYGMILFLFAMLVTSVGGVSSVYLVLFGILVGNLYGYFRDKKEASNP